MPCRGFFSNGYGYHDGFYGGGGFFMMLLVLIIVLAAVFIIVRTKKQGTISQFSQSDSSALKILNERFAKGEISEEEYKKMKETIGS